MTALDRLIPQFRRVEVDRIYVRASAARVWQLIRERELPMPRFAKALFALRTIADHDAGPVTRRFDDFVSTPEKPGFQLLVDERQELAVGAIGKVWKPSIPFVHVRDAEAYEQFDFDGWIKVAWAIRVVALGAAESRIEFEVRVMSTDDASWKKFARYFALIGPFSRRIRKSVLAQYAKRVAQDLAGDDLLPDARGQRTHEITIRATPAQIWPWLVQMGCRRGGYYALDVLDNANVPSAREIHPDLQQLEIGQMLPATPDAKASFEVLRIEPERALVIGALFDLERNAQLAFASARPDQFSQMTWAFVLDRIDDATTRLRVRVRAKFSPRGWLHAAWAVPAHEIMERVQLANVKRRAEGRLPSSGWRDVVTGIAGAARMALDYAMPFARRERSHWGVPTEHVYPGDDLVVHPQWGWTHAIEIDAPAERVWPWIAQIGVGRGGFYSYQWLENLAGCGVRNAESVHGEWQYQRGDKLLLHPDMPPMTIVALEPNRYFIAYVPPARAERWVNASWLFMLEPISETRCRFVSRYRVQTSKDWWTRTTFGEALVEPIGFEMDRAMLLGVKERVEHAQAR